MMIGPVTNKHTKRATISASACLDSSFRLQLIALDHSIARKNNTRGEKLANSWRGGHRPLHLTFVGPFRVIDDIGASVTRVINSWKQLFIISG
jgi:hypothetical protein